MTTHILSNYKVLTTGVQGGHKYLSAKIFYYGSEMYLPILFKDKTEENLFVELPVIAMKGEFKEEGIPFTITLIEAEQIDLPTDNNWLTFFITYFLENGVRSITIWEYSGGFTISPDFEHYYLSTDLSKDRKTVKKIQFGRLLPQENAEQIRKFASWTKGVFVNDQAKCIQFMQTSLDGEVGKKFQIVYTEKNIKRVSDFLAIPFNIGWTEFNYRIGEDTFYKAGAKTVVDNATFENTFVLLDVGEQDMPYPTDKIDQWIRRRWYDSAINDHFRRIDEIKIPPINHHN